MSKQKAKKKKKGNGKKQNRNLNKPVNKQNQNNKNTQKNKAEILEKAVAVKTKTEVNKEQENEEINENTEKLNNKSNTKKAKHAVDKKEIKREKNKTKKQEKQPNEQQEKEKKRNEKNPKKLKEKKTKGKAKDEKTEKSKDKKETKKKLSKKSIKKIVITIIIVALIAVAILAYVLLRPKFKETQVELGTEEVTIENFLVSKLYKDGAEFVTDMSQIDLTQVGEYDITLKYMNKEETVKLKIADTTPPEVIFKDITKYIDYEINPEDFIEDKKDESEMTIELVNAPEELTEFSDYDITIKVKDLYGNETIKTCKLTITWIKSEIYIELGTELKLEDLVFNVEEFGESVSKEDLANVNTSELGEYIVHAEKDESQYQTKVIVQDTTPPTLELKDITIYDDEKVGDYKNFIKTVSDASGEPTTTLKTEIDYKKIGTQEIVIEAVDVNGNVTEMAATLTIKKDTEGPVISGAGNLTVNKHATINYLSGVSANDKKDGKCEVTVDSSGVNTSVAGTYYATYTSKDKKGNTTTVKRKITVNHDADDTNAKMNEFFNNYCAGKDPVSIASAVRTHVKYNSNWGGEDPVWYGLTEGKGNCYVHASILKRALEKAGYQNRIIYLTDQSHYWNLVYVNGVWRHLDGTPSANHTLGLLTDEQKLADPGVHQKTWNREAWPAAE